ncbi:MAG: cytochrome P450 [Actinomycetota bacterium]|nr:cytochrome P450 [Actinomycetota bacterium]
MPAPGRPPSPKGRLLSGHIVPMRRDSLGFMTRAAREHGDVVGLRFGPSRALLLSHPDQVEQVLVTQRRSFAKGKAVLLIGRVTGDGLVVSEGDFWRRQRRLIQPAFHHGRIAAYGDTMVAFTERRLDTWSDGETRDVHEELMGLTLEIVVKTLFDADVSREAETEVGSAVEVAVGCLNEVLTSFLFFVPPGVPIPTNLRLKRAVKRLDAVLYRIIEEHRASGIDRGDLLSTLLRARDEDDGSHMTDRQVRDEAMTLFLAGHETTSIALTWAWYLLSQHPEAEARLHEELDDVLGGRAPTVADVPNLQYAGHVVTETLRLYPPAPALGREAVEGCEVAGYPVRKGTDVIVSQWVIQRDPRWFDDPEAFRPERWEDDLARRIPRFAYFPFGGGQRTCIGSSFATMEATLLLATMAQRFRFRLVEGHPVEPQARFTLRPAHGMRMVLEARTPAVVRAAGA